MNFSTCYKSWQIRSIEFPFHVFYKTYVQKCMPWRKWRKIASLCRTLSWMPKVSPWRLAILTKSPEGLWYPRNVAKVQIGCQKWPLKSLFPPFSPNMPFLPKLPLSIGPLCHLIWIFVYSVAILAFNHLFCHFRQIHHFRKTRHFPKGPFAISFEFLFKIQFGDFGN